MIGSQLRDIDSIWVFLIHLYSAQSPEQGYKYFISVRPLVVYLWKIQWLQYWENLRCNVCNHTQKTHPNPGKQEFHVLLVAFSSWGVDSIVFSFTCIQASFRDSVINISFQFGSLLLFVDERINDYNTEKT